MRKSLTLGLSLVCLVGAVITFVDASRYQYHLYQRYGYTTPNYSQHRHESVYRPYAASYDNAYANAYRNIYRNQYKAECDLRDVYGCHYYNTQTLYQPAKDPLDYKLQRPQLYPRVENTFQTNRLVVRNGDYIDRAIVYNGEPKVEDLMVVDPVYYTIDTTAYSKDGQGTYRKARTSLAFRVVQSPSDYKCSLTNFWACAGRLTSDFQDSQNLHTISNNTRDNRWNDTQLADFNRYPTVTESFDASGRSYFIFSALNPADGSIIRIEGVALQSEKNSAAEEMYRVFESFRFRQ